ncbi:MAG: GNAT family N-acetyltransferase [Cellulomonas sp.]
MPLPTELPRLIEAPLVLRAFTTADVPLVQEASIDHFIPQITSVPTTTDRPAALRFIDRQEGRLRAGEGYSFAIADATTEEAFGQIGLWLPNLAQGRASVGYWVVARHRGRGIATQALGLISTWGLGLPGVHRLELYVEPWNDASWRTAERAGYEREGLLRSWQVISGVRRDMYLYSRLRTAPDDDA